MDGSMDGIVGKKIKLILKNGDVYHGVIISRTESQITIIDKFNYKVIIAVDSISILKEVSN